MHARIPRRAQRAPPRRNPPLPPPRAPADSAAQPAALVVREALDTRAWGARPAARTREGANTRRRPAQHQQAAPLVLPPPRSAPPLVPPPLVLPLSAPPLNPLPPPPRVRGAGALRREGP